MSRPRLLVVVGQTGTGKSALAVELALRLGGEIVGCDAMQVYRGLDAGTAKPDASERARVPHHLVDVADPREPFSAAAWARAADRAIEAIASRGRVPVVVGGTGLYLRALLDGLLHTPDRDRALQRRLASIAARGGTARLHRLLARHDPSSAARIAPTDRQRIVRALELVHSGVPWSERIRADAGARSTAPPRYPTVKLGLQASPDWLEPRLERRVERFFEDGLVDEVRALIAAGVPREANAFKAIGYREVLASLDAGRDPLDARERIVRATRRYAKRQRTWFRREADVLWLEAAAGRDENAARGVDAWRRA